MHLSRAAAIVDLRIQNMQRVSTRGLDFNTSYARALGARRPETEPGWHVAVSLHTAGGVRTAAPQQLLNTQNNPINLKMRGRASWQQRRWGGTLGINFQNHYMDKASEPNRPISAYTTFDTQLRYELGAVERRLSRQHAPRAECDQRLQQESPVPE